MQSQTIQHDNGPRAGRVNPERNAVKQQKNFSVSRFEVSMALMLSLTFRNNVTPPSFKGQGVLEEKLFYES
jgi:hypothetical protein